MGFGVGLTTTTTGKGDTGRLVPEFDEDCVGGEEIACDLIVGDTDLLRSFELSTDSTAAVLDWTGGIMEIESSAAGVGSRDDVEVSTSSSSSTFGVLIGKRSLAWKFCSECCEFGRIS